MAAVFLVVIPSPEYEKKLEINCNIDLEGQNQINTSPNSNNQLILNELPDHADKVQVDHQLNGVSSDSPTTKNRSMKQELEVGLTKLNIEASTWTLSSDGNFFQVVFPCESQERCEEILDEFYFNGIGRFKDSSVSLVPCSVFNKSDDDLDACLKELNFDQKDDKVVENWKTSFIKSIKARLTVAQVVDDVRAGTLITFDFIALLFLASLIAGFGLMDNSSVSIVASMLVSPLMGPIMALSFSFVISDRQLFKLGVKAELLGLCICITTGLILGLINAPWATGWGRGPWPTSEMFGRGQTRALWVGMLVALPSGAGVAMSILGGNVSALVGVAISASLLPPCVNAGILWGNAIILSIKARLEDQMETIIYNGQSITEKPSLLPSPDYVAQYSTNMSYESGALGVISLCLALVNIASIILMAIIVFKIKEVAPPGSMPATSRFWREDIKITRDYNRTIHKHDPADLGQRFQQEWTDLVNQANESGNSIDANRNVNMMAELADIVQEAEEDEVYQTVRQLTHPQRVGSPVGKQLTWIPEGDDFKHPPVWEAFRNSSRRSYMSTRRRNLTLVEARNKRCSVTNRAKSLSPTKSEEIDVEQGASRFQVTKVPSIPKQVRKPRSVRMTSKKYLEADM